MPTSPPEEPAEFRSRNLTPVSPKPLLFPSPSNIPILERQMEADFNGALTQMVPENAQADAPADPASSESSLYNNSDGASDTGGKEQKALDAQSNDDYAENLNFEEDLDTQDTSAIKPVEQPIHSTADASSEAASAATLVNNPYNPSADAYTQNPSAQGIAQQPFEDPAAAIGEGPGVDFQALLDNITSGGANMSSQQALALESNGNAAIPDQQADPTGALKSPAASLPNHPGLPPRPPPQEKPITHPNYDPTDDIRNYHPHSGGKPASAAYRSQQVAPLVTGQAAAGSNGLPAPPSATFQATPSSATQRVGSPSTPTKYRQRDSLERNTQETVNDDEAPWPADIQRLYDAFLNDERSYVTEGQWDKFPPNSRLFIGNLPTEKVTKRDLFHNFHKYGKLAQISIKQAYGFVQFLDAAACYQALQGEQGAVVRGRKIHLEISKPQRGNKDKDRGGQRRRSRSPDYTRGGTGQRGSDRYSGGGQNGSPRTNEFRRGRDDYRPGRSPSPRGYRRGGRDRSRDRFDGRRRSRSRSPYGRGGRYRSPPRRDEDDDLPLPRRAPEMVPDVQIIVMGDLDRNFIAYVERVFRDRALKADVLLLSPRLSEPAVIRRQILEGVQALSRLTYVNQGSGKIPLQVFDRRAGVDNVRFEEYEDIDPTIAAELVIRAKQTHQPPPTVGYGLPPTGYGLPPQYGLPSAQQPAQAAPPQAPAAAVNSNLSSLLGGISGGDIQKLLGQVQQQQPGAAPDLARLLGAAGQQQPAPGQTHAQFQQQQNNAYSALAANPSLAGLLGGSAPAPRPSAPSAQAVPQAPPTGNPDMNEILARLATYQR